MARISRLPSMVASLAAVALWFAAPAGAAFPGANGKIAFTDSNGRIAVINPDGTGFSEPGEILGARPVWSSDGRKLAFQSDVGPPGCCGFNIVTMTAGGSDLRTLTHGIDAWDPTWSPDGTKLAYTDQSVGAIHVINADGTDDTRISPILINDRQPTWSPDGTRIAISRDTERPSQPRYAVYTIDPDGSDATGLTERGIGLRNPAWTPDGSTISFTIGGFGGDFLADVWLMNADGSGQRRLDDLSVLRYEGPIAWSPDGSKIAFARYGSPCASCSPTIYVADANGEHARPLVVGEYPDWQPLQISVPPSSPRNRAAFCKGERRRLGEAFAHTYRNLGRCVSARRR